MQPTPSPDTPTADIASQSLWASLRDAIRGTNADYTRIPLRRAVFLLAVPMVLELVLESTFAVVDIFFVGKLGASAVATVGLTETYLFLLYSIAMGLAMGVTALIARRVGEGAAAEASVTATKQGMGKSFLSVSGVCTKPGRIRVTPILLPASSRRRVSAR